MSVSLDTAFNGQPFVEHGGVAGSLDYVHNGHIFYGTASSAAAELEASISNSSTASAALSTQIPLSSSISIAAVVTGAIYDPALVTGSAAASSAATASISTQIALSVAATNTASANSNLTTQIHLATSSVSTSTATASLTVTTALTGAATNVATASASMSTAIALTNIAPSLQDSSIKAHTVTLENGAVLSTAQSLYDGVGLSLPSVAGTGRAASIPDSVDWRFGSGQFTAELNVRFSSTQSNSSLVGQWGGTYEEGSWALFILSNLLMFRFYPTGGGTFDTSFNWTRSTDVWYHIAVDRSASGVIRLYVDGVVRATQSASHTIKTGTNPLKLGVVQGYESTYNLDGYIDEVRITKGVARYAGAFTPPSAPYPDSVAGDANFNSVVLLTHFNYATTTKGAASAIADLRSAALLQGAILATSTTTASITTGIPLSASITAVSSYVATLSTGHSLEAEILNVVDGVADLTTAIPLASAVVAVVSAGATLFAPFFIASISVSTEASASLSTGIRLRGTLVSSPSYNAHLSTGGGAVVPYTANPVFPFPHNWDKELLETLEWKTDVLVGETGKEQRVSRRLTPRRSFEATFLLEKEALQFFENFMAMYGGSVMVIPLWHAVTRLTADMVVGVSSMSVDTTFNEFTIGGLVALRSAAPGAWVAQSIESLNDTTVYLTSGAEEVRKQGTPVYPAVLARVEDSTKVKKITDSAVEITVRFTVEDESYHASNWVPSLFEGRAVYDVPPDDSEELSFENQRLFSIVDNGIGRPAGYDMAGVQLKTYSYLWSVSGRTKLDDLKKVLYWLRGRARSIWLPTFMEDLKLISNTATNGTSLTVGNVGYTRFSMHTRKRDAIRVQMWDGTIYYRRITGGAEYDAYSEVLSVNIAWPVGFSPSSVARISYIVSVRLDQDKLEFKHPTDTDGITQCEVTWKELAGELNIVEFLGNGANAISYTRFAVPTITVFQTPDTFPSAYSLVNYIYNPQVHEFWIAGYIKDYFGGDTGFTRMNADTGEIIQNVTMNIPMGRDAALIPMLIQSDGQPLGREVYALLYNEVRGEIYADVGYANDYNYYQSGYDAQRASPISLLPTWNESMDKPLLTLARLGHFSYYDDYPYENTYPAVQSYPYGWLNGTIYSVIAIEPDTGFLMLYGRSYITNEKQGYTLRTYFYKAKPIHDPKYDYDVEPFPPEYPLDEIPSPELIGSALMPNGLTGHFFVGVDSRLWEVITEDPDNRGFRNLVLRGYSWKATTPNAATIDINTPAGFAVDMDITVGALTYTLLEKTKGYVALVGYIPDRHCVWVLVNHYSVPFGQSSPATPTVPVIYEFSIDNPYVPLRSFEVASGGFGQDGGSGSWRTQLVYDTVNQVMWYVSNVDNVVGIRISDGSIFRKVYVASEKLAFDLTKITILNNILWVQSESAYNPATEGYNPAMVRITHPITCD